MKAVRFTIVLIALLAAAAPAHAFSESNGGAYANSDGTSKFSDPDEQLDEGAGGRSPVNTLKFGNGGALNFGAQSSGDTPDNVNPRSALSH